MSSMGFLPTPRRSWSAVGTGCARAERSLPHSDQLLWLIVEEVEEVLKGAALAARAASELPCEGGETEPAEHDRARLWCGHGDDLTALAASRNLILSFSERSVQPGCGRGLV